jgi:hypothetical protein
MNQAPNSDWTDEQIIECIRHWSLEQVKHGPDGDLYNQINSEYFVPCAQILKNRGMASLAKLLPLLDDENADIRLTAASIAYEADRARCRRVLLTLMKTPDRLGIIAWGSLAALDPTNAPKPTEIWGDQP